MPSHARLAGADIVLLTSLDADDLEAVLLHVVDGSPFRLLHAVLEDGAWRCRFVAAHPELALAWRNVVDLQWRLGAYADIAAVERLDHGVLELAGV